MDVITEIEDITEFIQQVYQYSNKLLANNSKNEIVYRGQSSFEYDLKPSLFRKKLETQFEYNQIHFLKASKFVEESIELEIGIRAQHYGYLTRLLDVTYNSLISLFFACYNNTKKVIEDGAVFIISVEKYIPPTAYELAEFYKKIIENSDIFETIDASFIDPIIIENIKNNDRIIAQSGAFLLYFNQNHEIKSSSFYKMKISGMHKDKLLKQLDQLFKINYGTVFPDIQSNSIVFNSIEGRKKYMWMKTSNLYEIIINKSIINCIENYNFKNQSISCNNIPKSQQKERIYRYISKLVDIYFDYKPVKERNNMKESYLEKIEG